MQAYSPLKTRPLPSCNRSSAPFGRRYGASLLRTVVCLRPPQLVSQAQPMALPESLLLPVTVCTP